MVLRQRQVRGRRHHAAKIQTPQARSILQDTRSLKAIADDYGVSTSLISQIRSGKIWKHAAAAVTAPIPANDTGAMQRTGGAPDAA